MTNKPRRALSRMRMAMVIRVQHLEQMSAALKSEFVLSRCSDRPDMLNYQHSNQMNHITQLPAAASDIIIICHVDIKHQLLLKGLEGSRLHCVVLTGLWVTKKTKTDATPSNMSAATQQH